MSSFPPKNIIIFPCGGTANESKKKTTCGRGGGGGGGVFSFRAFHLENNHCIPTIPETYGNMAAQKGWWYGRISLTVLTASWSWWGPGGGGGGGEGGRVYNTQNGPGVRLRHPTMRNNRTPPSQNRNRIKTRSRFSIHEYDRRKTFVGVLVPWHPQHWQSPP